MRSRPEAERAFFAAVDGARAMLARQSARPLLTREAAEGLAVSWFLEAIEEGEDVRRPKSPDALGNALDFANERAAEARQALAEGDLQEWEERATRLRESEGYASDPQADALLKRLLGRATVAAEEVERGRLVGDYGQLPKDPLFAAAMDPARAPNVPPSIEAAPPKAAPSNTVTDLERAFRQTKFPTLSPSTVQGYAPVFRILRDVLGEETAVATISHADGLRLFETIRNLPTNALKHGALKGLGTVEAVAEGKRLGLPTVSAKTINDHYMANVGSLFRFAVGRGWMTINPVQGLRAPDPVSDRDRRDSFGPNLPILFGSAPWTPKDASNDLSYWGPLLGLFHGLRLGEVAGLQIQDVGREGEEPMLFIRNGKRPLKSKAARRDMPVHPALVSLGFLAFVKERQEAASGEDLLFAGQKAYAREQWGRGLGEWFGKRVKALGLPGRKLGMHSLRHDFRDALREAEVPDDLANYLMGHSQAGMGAIYGGRPTVARLKAAMSKVAYPELNIV